jgi:1-deoxyxylulose-5-phosphate synthase
MRYEVIGGSGLLVSRLSLGTAVFGVAPAASEATDLVSRALELGINVIDTANTYGNQARFDREGLPPAAQRASAEELVGAAIAGRRDELVVCTKVRVPISAAPNDSGLSRSHVLRMIDRSLRRLGTDYVDIYYAHHPDPTTDISEVLATFEDLIRAGKIRYYGLSNYSGWQLAEASLLADKLGIRRPVVHQAEYSLAKRRIETEIRPASRHFGIGTTAFSPLAGGLLTGAVTGRPTGSARWGGPGFGEHEVALADRFARLAREWGHEPRQVALAWVLSRPGLTSAIIGPESIPELDALAPAADLDLDAGQLAELDLITQGT